jgi:ribosomal protein S13
MASNRKKWGFVVVGAVAAVALGAIAVASAATSTSTAASPSPAASAQADGRHAPDFDGDGPHGAPDGDGGRGFRHGGAPDMAEALAELSGKDVSVIMEQRAGGKSLKQIAEAEGVDTARLVADAVAIEKAELDAEVKAGTLTEAQRTQIESGLQERFQQELAETGLPGGHGGPGVDGGHGRGFGGGAPDMAEALAALSGKDASTILQQHDAGKTFAQLARTYGVGTDELLAKTTAIEKAELDAAVKAGTLTDAQRTEILSGLQAHLEEELTEVHTGGFGHGFERDGEGTQAPSSSASPSTSGASLSY